MIRDSATLSASLLIILIQVYRNSLRHLFFCTCKFWPTCSQYAEEAVRRHGAAKGVWLSAKRLIKCHPWTLPNLDPVP